MLCVLLATPALLRAQGLKPPPQDYVLHFQPSAVVYAQQINLGPSFTMEAWIFLDVVTRGPLIMGKANNPRTADPFLHYAIGLELDSPMPRFAQTTGQAGSYRTIAGQSALPLFTWTHLAATLDAGVMRLYVNGQMVASGPSSGPPAGAGVPFSLGGLIGDPSDPSCYCSFSGGMREARVWSRALSASELRAYAVQKLTGNEPGLIANWPLSEGSGQVANAIGPPAAALIIKSGTTWVRTQLLDNGPYWEIQDLPTFSNIPDSWGGPVGLFLNANRRTDILLVFAPPNNVPNDGGPVLFLHNEGNRVFTPVIPAQPIITQGIRTTVTADFDRDGFEDIVLAGHGLDANPFPGGLTRIFMQRSGEMKEETNSRLTQELALTHDICSADINLDGSPDLLYAATNSSAPLIGPKLFLNNGLGFFTSANNRLPPVLQPRIALAFLSCKFADVNRDGAPDLLLGCCQGGPQDRDWLLLNDGRGNFRDVTAQSMPLKRGGSDWETLGFAVADFDRDGWPDVAATVSNFDTTLIQLLINNRDGTFRDQPDPVLNAIRTGAYDNFAYAPDLNQDAWPDLVVDQGGGAATVRLYQNMGGQFEDRTSTLPVAGFIANAHVADFDEDGRLDILLGANSLTRMAWGRNLWPPVSTGIPGPTVFDGGVVNHASFAPNPAPVAPGSIAAVFGTDLNDGSTKAAASFGADGKLGTVLGGASVTVNNTPTPMFYSTPSQLGIQIPFELAGQTSAAIRVTAGGQTSAGRVVNLNAVAPGIFTLNQLGTGIAGVLHEDGITVVTAQNPARPNEVVTFFATGFGALTPPLATGAPATGNQTVATATVTVDGIPADVQFSGATTGFVGLNHFRVRIPPSTRTALDIPVVLTIGGKQSNSVTIPVGP
ncbi:MAG: VCBS repeat-containing protein [Acidobacteria bacterium]|nr:VCBS repeat-containing protein [Acidobacteriota bacterium]